MKFPNGDFQTVPNRAWNTNSPNASRLVKGDRPLVLNGANGNNYGHIGDSDGIGAHGENPSRIFQWFSCAHKLGIDPHCTVTFRFRSLLVSGELAWVRMKSSSRQRVWAIPNSNNQWAAGRRFVTLSNVCDKTLFIDFGMIKQAGGKISGRLNIDDVEFQCNDLPVQPPVAAGWGFLPEVPKADSSTVVKNAPISMMTIRGKGNIAVAVLLMFSILLIFRKLRSY